MRKNAYPDPVETATDAQFAADSPTSPGDFPSA